MTTVVIVEKRRKVGEIEGSSIYVWEYYEAISPKYATGWFADRGFRIPSIRDIGFTTEIDYNFRATYVDISKEK